MVKMVDAVPDKNQQKALDKKLEKCRNPENNPDSEMYCFLLYLPIKFAFFHNQVIFFYDTAFFFYNIIIFI